MQRDKGRGGGQHSGSVRARAACGKLVCTWGICHLGYQILPAVALKSPGAQESQCLPASKTWLRGERKETLRSKLHETATVACVPHGNEDVFGAVCRCSLCSTLRTSLPNSFLNAALMPLLPGDISGAAVATGACTYSVAAGRFLLSISRVASKLVSGSGGSACCLCYPLPSNLCR